MISRNSLMDMVLQGFCVEAECRGIMRLRHTTYLLILLNILVRGEKAKEEPFEGCFPKWLFKGREAAA
jgi:hypothetical protein